MLKRVLLALVLMVAIGGGAATIAALLFTRGIGGFDNWVVREIVDIAETYIVPDVEFDDFRYDAPLGVRLEGVELVAPDGTAIVEAKVLEVALAKVPVRGEPIVIESVRIERGRLRLIAEPGAGGGTGFRGLVPFVEPKVRAAEDPNDAVPASRRLSEVLALRRIELADTEISYDDGSGRPPMVFSGIELATDIRPERDDAGRVLHDLDVEFGRDPVLSVALRGALDLDAVTLDLDELTLNADLGSEAGASALPPRLAELLAAYEARGAMQAVFSGRIDGRAPASSRLTGSVDLLDLHVAQDDLELLVDRVGLRTELSEGIVTLGEARADLLGGSIDLSGARYEIESRRLETPWRIDGVMLERLLRVRTEDEPPAFAGTIVASGDVRLRTGGVPASIDGAGELDVDRARLVEIPVLSSLFDALDVLGKLRGRDATEDELEATFDLTAEGVELSRLRIEVPVAELAGSGTVTWAGGLDLALRGGPIGKIPVIGDAASAITNQLARYLVRGTVDEVEVQVQPLGLGGS